MIFDIVEYIKIEETMPDMQDMQEVKDCQDMQEGQDIQHQCLRERASDTVPGGDSSCCAPRYLQG